MSDQGWGHPLRERRAHYFVDGQSLCGLVLYGGPVVRGHALPGDCKTCATCVRAEAATLARTGTWVSTPKAITYTQRSEVRH